MARRPRSPARSGRSVRAAQDRARIPRAALGVGVLIIMGVLLMQFGHARGTPLCVVQPRSRDGEHPRPPAGLVTLAAGADLELHLLALLEGLEPRSVDVREVDEHVVAVGAGDEAVPLLVVEELDRSGRHTLIHSLGGRARTRPPLPLTSTA
mgnify:CR=1 FL=1